MLEHGYDKDQTIKRLCARSDPYPGCPLLAKQTRDASTSRPGVYAIPFGRQKDMAPLPATRRDIPAGSQAGSATKGSPVERRASTKGESADHRHYTRPGGLALPLMDGGCRQGTHKKKTSVSYCERYVRKLLGAWGFSSQKPAYIAYEQSPEQVRQWIEQTYPALRKKAQSSHGLIFWLDETGLRSQHASGTSYAPVGHTPVIAKTGRRFYCNVISAIANNGRMFFSVLQTGFNGKAFIDFLSRLIKTTGRKLFIIADAHPVHRAGKVKQWIEANKGKIELHFLPGYAPQLNADEYFNQHFKSNGMGKQRPATKTEMVSMARALAKSIQARPELVKSFFDPAPVRFAKRYTKLGPE